MAKGAGPLPWQESALAQCLGAAHALAPPTAPLAERLGRWVGWTEAIDLAAALQVPDGAPGGEVEPAECLQRALQGLRDELAQPLFQGSGADRAALSSSQGRDPAASARFDLDPAALRRRYQSRQQRMEDGIDALRARVRRSVANTGLRRLAAIDAVMQRTLAAQERLQLARVPARLERRSQALLGPSATEPSIVAALLAELQDLLQAEVDHRLRPVLGLLAVLQKHSPSS